MKPRARKALCKLLRVAADAVRSALPLVAGNESVTARLADIAAELDFHAEAFEGHDAKA